MVINTSDGAGGQGKGTKDPIPQEVEAASEHELQVGPLMALGTDD